MAIRHKRVSVGTTATALQVLADDDESVVSVAVQNPSAVSVFLGGPSVSTTDYGYELAAGKEVGLDVRANVPLYAVIASGTQTVNVLAVELGGR